MLWFAKNHTFPIGVDMGDDTVKVVQLAKTPEGLKLIAGSSKNRPEYVEPGSVHWQKWTIESVKEITGNNKFHGRNVIGAVPASEVFTDHVRMPKPKNDLLEEAVFAKIKQKLPFDPDGAMVKYIPTEQDNVLVIAVDREKIDRYLAIYEKANLQINSIAVWPAALATSYVTFFGRREADIETVVMLIDIEASHTNLVICRHKNLLFARSIPIGAKQLDCYEKVSKLVLELTACTQHFDSMYRNVQIQRVIFLSGQTVVKDVYTIIAKQLKMPAQIGDCLSAVRVENPYLSAIDRRGCQFSWATAFGLSLSYN